MHGSQALLEGGGDVAAAGRQAELVFTRAPDGRTYISHQRVGYPFHITRPFYLDPVPAGLLTLYLQSVSGGIYRGERLALSLEAGENLAAVHAGLEQLERDAPVDWLFLLGQEDFGETALAD